MAVSGRVPTSITAMWGRVKDTAAGHGAVGVEELPGNVCLFRLVACLVIR